MMFSPNSEGLQCILTWWVPSENDNSKPQGGPRGNLDKTLFSSLLTSFVKIRFKLALRKWVVN